MKIQITPPSHCACGSSTVEITDPKSGVTQHWCENPYCEAKLKARLEYLAGRTVLEIDELGPELIEKLVTGEYVTQLSDLFCFANDINDQVDKVSASVKKMARSVEQAKTRDWDKWIAALDMPNIGRSLGKVLAMQCRLQPDDLPNLRQILTKTFTEEKIDGIGDIRKTELLDYFAKHGPDFDEELNALYEAGVRPLALIQAITGGSQPLTGYAICITGEFTEDREKVSAKLSILGATMKTGVSKKLTHLLAGEGAGRSKLAKAVELNIPKLDSKWLETTLEANGMKLEKTGFNADWDDEEFA